MIMKMNIGSDRSGLSLLIIIMMIKFRVRHSFLCGFKFFKHGIFLSSVSFGYFYYNYFFTFKLEKYLLFALNVNSYLNMKTS